MFRPIFPIMQQTAEPTAPGRWTFPSNHAHVLICIARNPEARLRDIALAVDITERTAQRIINQLRDASVLNLEKAGRRNHYTINLDSELRHPLEAESTVGDLLTTLLDDHELERIRVAYRRATSG
mgnify:CR=1 FL=1